jgi:ABC-type branched-subunit amino acid transport system ATPase component
LLVVNVVILNLGDITGGVNGTVVPSWYGWPYLVGLLVICCFVFVRLRGSRLGLAGVVVRADPLVAGALGIDTASVQRTAFVIAGAIGGVAGILLASLLAFLDPTTYYLNLAFLCMSAVVLGGSYRWQGALVGAFVFTGIPRLLEGYAAPEVTPIINGGLIIAIAILLPSGLFDPERFGRLARRWRDVEADLSEDERSFSDEERRLKVLTAGAVRQEDAIGPAVTMADVSKAFGGVLAVDGISGAIPAGCVYGIVGPNGAGKTTLVNVLSGVLIPDSGKIELFGKDIITLPSHVRARLGLARTYQNIRLTPGLTALDAVISGMYTRRDGSLLRSLVFARGERAERKRCAEEARELLASVGVTASPNRLASTLSYGDQRRVEIARALASRASVVLLDEPTAGMNPRESAAIGDLVRTLAEHGLTVVLIEHNMQLVRECCDRVLVMSSGRELVEGLPGECLEHPAVLEAYFGRRGDAQRLQTLR